MTKKKPSAPTADKHTHETSLASPHATATKLVHSGRDPAANDGFVNPPVYRGSTILFPDVATLKAHNQPYTYGRIGTPTTHALETALAEIEGGARTLLTASGLQAVALALLSLVKSGDTILMVDSVYQPTRTFCDHVLADLGVTTHYYDPLVGAGIADLITPATRVVFTESPGSQTFEIQDIPAIAAVCNHHDIWLVMDNTWATPHFFQPFDHGVDIAIHAATKYIVGHADAMLGAVTTTERGRPLLERTRYLHGMCPGSEETYLGMRGLRTLGVRLAQHQASAIEIATWLEARDEVARVLHPALASHPQHTLWQRDFTGASGLFGAVLKPTSDAAIAAMLDGLELFGMGYSWGGFESLVLPVDPTSYRTATRWPGCGQVLRFHIGLEAVDDLKVDLAAGFARLASA